MKISDQQKATLIEILKDKPKLVSGKFDSSFTHSIAKAEWEAIATTLNSMPGSQKDWKNWRSTWQHIRSRTKQKQAQDLRNRKMTGGGPEEITVNQQDETVLSFIKTVMVEGHAIREPTVKSVTEQKASNTQLLGETEPIILEENEPPSTSQGRRIRKIPQRPYGKVKHSDDAATAYKYSLDKKNAIKEKYYEKKIDILERNAVSNESIANALEILSENIIFNSS